MRPENFLERMYRILMTQVRDMGENGILEVVVTAQIYDILRSELAALRIPRKFGEIKIAEQYPELEIFITGDRYLKIRREKKENDE